MHIKTPNLIKFILFLVVFSCKTKEVSKNNQIDINNSNNKEIIKKLQSPNKTKTLVLNYIQGKDPIIKYNYKVIDTKSSKELTSGTFIGTYMEWMDDNNIKGYKYVGMIEKEDDEILDNNIKKNSNNYIIIKIN